MKTVQLARHHVAATDFSGPFMDGAVPDVACSFGNSCKVAITGEAGNPDNVFDRMRGYDACVKSTLEAAID
jgi:hypothetical protein